MTDDELRKTLADLRAAVSARPGKDAWDKFAIATTFIATVLLATLTWYYNVVSEKIEAERQQSYDQVQRRAAELDVVLKLLPQLSSPDATERNNAANILRIINSQGRDKQASLLEEFARVALADNSTPGDRTYATRVLAAFAERPGVPSVIRERAVQVVTDVAAAPSAPAEARALASEVLQRITRVSAEDISRVIAQQPLTRRVTDIILHHSGKPSAKEYRGVETVVALSRRQLTRREWEQLGWHYAVAPDGAIWLGVPLNQQAHSIVREKAASVAVLLILDADHERISSEQRRALAILLRALLRRLQLKADDAFDDHHGFHRDYDRRTSCPGSLLSKSELRQWLSKSFSREKAGA